MLELSYKDFKAAGISIVNVLLVSTLEKPGKTSS